MSNGSKITPILNDAGVTAKQPPILWTDARVALAWIQGEPDRWQQYVANRVEDITVIAGPSNCRRCPGK